MNSLICDHYLLMSSSTTLGVTHGLLLTIMILDRIGENERFIRIASARMVSVAERAGQNRVDRDLAPAPESQVAGMYVVYLRQEKDLLTGKLSRAQVLEYSLQFFCCYFRCQTTCINVASQTGPYRRSLLSIVSACSNRACLLKMSHTTNFTQYIGASTTQRDECSQSSGSRR
jgi:hypothetical protein